MIGAHAALLKNYGAKAEAMNDLVAEIEGVFDEDPKDGVAAANAFSVSSQADNRVKKDTEMATPSNQGTKSRIFAGCRIECKIMEAGVKLSYPATVIEEIDTEKQLFTILYDGYFTLYEFSAHEDEYELLLQFEDKHIRDPRLKALAFETRRLYYICQSFDNYLAQEKTLKELEYEQGGPIALPEKLSYDHCLELHQNASNYLYTFEGYDQLSPEQEAAKNRKTIWLGLLKKYLDTCGIWIKRKNDLMAKTLVRNEPDNLYKMLDEAKSLLKTATTEERSTGLFLLLTQSY